MKLSRSQVMERLGVSRSTLYRYETKHGFPRPVGPTAKMKRYDSAEIEHWLNGTTAMDDNRQHAS